MSERQKKREEQERAPHTTEGENNTREDAESVRENTARLFRASEAATERAVRATDTEAFLQNTQQLGGE